MRHVLFVWMPSNSGHRQFHDHILWFFFYVFLSLALTLSLCFFLFDFLWLDANCGFSSHHNSCDHGTALNTVFDFGALKLPQIHVFLDIFLWRLYCGYFYILLFLVIGCETKLFGFRFYQNDLNDMFTFFWQILSYSSHKIVRKLPAIVLLMWKLFNLPLRYGSEIIKQTMWINLKTFCI